jgi:mRNA (guanine-N7-)-methyltransferase
MYQKDRQSSSIANIRTFHNQVKSELLAEASNHLIESYGVKNIRLLDLAVGRGGDIQKWYYNKIMNVVGFDIDEASIQEARKRYGEFIATLKRKHVKYLPRYEFYVMDLSLPENLDKIKNILQAKKFDIVSCQFAIHYFFREKSALDTLFNIIQSYIAPHGFFVATTMNGDKLREMFKETKVLSNDIYKIEASDKITSKNPYGNTYYVSMGKSEDKGHYFVGKVSEEYLVNLDELSDVAEAHNLMFLGQTDFNEWYRILNKNILDDQDKEFSFLNMSFVFTTKRN